VVAAKSGHYGQGIVSPPVLEVAPFLGRRREVADVRNLLTSARLVRAFRHALGRMPETDEVSVLHKTYEQQLQEFRDNPEAAKALIKVGESAAPEKVDFAELAAMTAVSNVLLNLNETISK